MNNFTSGSFFVFGKPFDDYESDHIFIILYSILVAVFELGSNICIWKLAGEQTKMPVSFNALLFYYVVENDTKL